MPIYEYRCDNCSHELETIQKVSDPPLKTCPACEQDTLRKRISAAAFRLKGGGWYETDFKSDRKRNVAGEDKTDGGKGSKEGGEGGKDSGEAAKGSKNGGEKGSSDSSGSGGSSESAGRNSKSDSGKTGSEGKGTSSTPKTKASE